MKKISAYFFFFFISLSNQALGLDIPAIANDATAFAGDLLHSSYESISSPVPPDFDFWRSAKDLGDKVNTYTTEILNDAAVQDKVNGFKETMSRVVTSAEAMGTILQDVDLEEFQNLFEAELSRVFEELKKEFSEPLPEDQTERYRQLATTISQALNGTEDALVNVCKILNIPEADVRTKFGDIKPHINHALLIVVNLVDKHPVLFTTLVVSALISIIPDSSYLILRPILRLFGFGLLGPVKGSVAASAQRLFFGAVVEEASWFSVLQHVGMKVVL